MTLGGAKPARVKGTQGGEGRDRRGRQPAASPRTLKIHLRSPGPQALGQEDCNKALCFGVEGRQEERGFVSSAPPLFPLVRSPHRGSTPPESQVALGPFQIQATWGVSVIYFWEQTFHKRGVRCVGHRARQPQGAPPSWASKAVHGRGGGALERTQSDR